MQKGNTVLAYVDATSTLSCDSDVDLEASGPSVCLASSADFPAPHSCWSTFEPMVRLPVSWDGEAEGSPSRLHNNGRDTQDRWSTATFTVMVRTSTGSSRSGRV